MNWSLIHESLSRVSKDLLHAHKIGKIECQIFKKTRLEDPPTLKFHDKMKKLNLETFSDVVAKRTSGRGKAEEVVLLFRHMLSCC